jgi:beta-mannosidase
MFATPEAHAAGSKSLCRQRFLHDNWQFALAPWREPEAKVACSTLEWLPARVPGHVHLDLIEQGVIADPFERMNELGCQWVDEQEVSYRTRFEFAPDSGRPQRVLRFEGLDTLCSVYLNGELVAEHRNMFVPLEIDVSARLVSGENQLELRFDSAVKVGQKLRAEYFAEQGLAGTTARFDERSFVRKAQYMYGWDWGPRLVSAGVWRPVSLLEYSARIHDVHVTQAHSEDGAVRVTARTSADAGVIVHVFSDLPARGGDGQVAHLPRPERWYPHGLGAQPLYTLTTYLCPAGFDAASLPTDEAGMRGRLAAVAYDERTTKIGIRTARLLQEVDALGRSFEFEVNGERIFVLGANWIPDHSFPSRVTRRALRERLESARDVGMNMLRVWGGGLYESDDFYELCDELGLLVWQDFPFGCAYYPDTGEYCETLREEASVNVRRLRNHPSLVLWCGNNENLIMWQSSWGGKEHQPHRYFGEHLYDRVLPQVLRELDAERPYIPTSPQGGETDANSGGTGDQHYWDVWHGRGDWPFYRDSGARFSSEYGFASSCSMRAWQTVFAPRAPAAVRENEVGLNNLRASVRDPIVRWHDKTAKGYEVFLSYVALHYPEPQSLEDWVYYSQLNQRDALRCALEHYRRSDFCKGSLIWQLNDCWPVQSWALIDSEAQPKSAWYELRRLHAPQLLSIVVSGDHAELYASLDNSRAGWQADVSLTAFSLRTGAELRTARGSLSLSGAQRKSALRLPLADLKPSGTLLVASSGSVTAQALLAEPKQLELPPAAPLTVSLESDGVIELGSSTPLLDLVLTDAAGTAAFLDNCVSLPRPGVIRLRYRGDGRSLEARSLAGRHDLNRSPARLI